MAEPGPCEISALNLTIIPPAVPIVHIDRFATAKQAYHFFFCTKKYKLFSIWH